MYAVYCILNPDKMLEMSLRHSHSDSYHMSHMQWFMDYESWYTTFHSFRKFFIESLNKIWPQLFHLQHGVKNSFWDQSPRFDSFWHVLPKFDFRWLFMARCVPNSTIWPKFDLWRLLKVIIFDQKIVEVANTLFSSFQNV